ncbi:MAG: DUF5644 domain-containing protein [Campylobacteraceae bacterium]|jgi:succinate dehydrogenase/fumarate reductase-like Fe-S protein|nr:DUF5644 domain-containing protein [Campylobacteraceae bacterium]
MSYTLNISAFRFNAKTDFLPYYKNYKIKIDKDAKLSDVLNSIKDQDNSFSFSNNRFLAIKVNRIATYTRTPIKTIIDKFKTTDIKIEPISEFRAINDFEIDTADFDKKIEILRPFIKEKIDEECYHELISYYYISPSLEFEREYFGDSILLFAVYLIKKYPQNRDAILKIIADENYGIWLYTSYGNLIMTYQNAVNIEDNVAELKREILKYVPDTNNITKREAKRIKNLSF